MRIEHCLKINMSTTEEQSHKYLCPLSLCLPLPVTYPAHATHPEHYSFLEQDEDNTPLPHIPNLSPASLSLHPSLILCASSFSISVLCKTLSRLNAADEKRKGQPCLAFWPEPTLSLFCCLVHFVWPSHCHPSSFLPVFNSIKISAMAGTLFLTM